MTALELNAEFYKTMGIIANDESLMSKALKYTSKNLRHQNRQPKTRP